jgi:2-dehydrotetronate isomerase
MKKFCANISTMYPEAPFLARIALAANDGFRAVECQFPYEVSAQALRDALRAANVTLQLLNTPPGDFANGDRGTGAIPSRVAEYRDGVERAIFYAQASGCPLVHLMAGIPPSEVSASQARETFLQNLAWAAPKLQAAGLTGLIEPINTRDIPGYFLNFQADAHAIVQAIGSPHLKVQMDLYHLQIMEGDLATKLKTWLPTGRVAHLQIAGVPHRFEPDVGELNYPYLFDLIEELGYDGWIGCEYKPARGSVAGGTSAGLGWLRKER